MNDTPPPCSAEAFEQRYRRRVDPWEFTTSPYETHRHQTTLKTLGRDGYQSAYEPGCAEGALTAQLATRCRRLFATDISPTAVARARARCAALSNVEIACADFSSMLPPINCDLIVMSELGYYLTAERLSILIPLLAERLQARGEWVAVHWLGHSQDHLLSGDEVHQILNETLPLRLARTHRHEGFRIDSWIKQ